VGDPVLHLIAGPNGAGKTTLHRTVIEPVAHLLFINADLIAHDRWPGEELEHAAEAAAIAATDRVQCLAQRQSFVTETVFSHPSKIELLQSAADAGYRTYLHIVLIPEALAVARVAERVADGDHQVPEEKVRGRFARLWGHLAVAIEVAAEARVYDNSDPRTPLRLIATYINGQRADAIEWPAWVPDELRTAGH
jgi:predicted ABC-type ATPase